MKQPYKQKLPVMVDLQDNVYKANGNAQPYGKIPSSADKVTSTYPEKAENRPDVNKRYQQPQTQQSPVQGTGGSTNDPYVAQANALYQQLMNRGAFRYDLQGDMLYRQYADQYQQLGLQAMKDTMGYASGQTGGYNSSWGQTLGQQAYQGYLGQLNSMIPDFYNRAYQAYLNEGDRLMEQYQLALQHPGYIAAMRGGGGGGGSQDQTQKDAANTLSEEAIRAYIANLDGGRITNGITGGSNLSGEALANKLDAKTLAEQVGGQQPDFNYFDDWYKYIVNQERQKRMK